MHSAKSLPSLISNPWEPIWTNLGRILTSMVMLSLWIMRLHQRLFSLERRGFLSMRRRAMFLGLGLDEAIAHYA
ncbi:hypothetical protein LB505_012586 [Fusarium chuoi]|nr:hypothetical protein LB505_012586 [Fusarium chuoi]